MIPRILVAYASRAGSTAEIAEEIGREMNSSEAMAEVRSVTENFDIHTYTAAVIGGPIYMGRVVSEVASFVRTNQAALECIPVAAFAVGGSLTDRSEESLEWARHLLEKAIEPVHAREIGLFAGFLNLTRMSVSQRVILRCLWGKSGDFRDWEMIRGWARMLPAILMQDSPQTNSRPI